MNLPGYQLGELISETAQVSVYRATRLEDNTAVIVKTLGAEYPSNQDIAMIRREFRIEQKLADVEGVVHVHTLETYGYGNLAIVMEPFGMSLAQFIKESASRPLPLKRFINIAINITRALGHIHQKDVVHKDVVPRNIRLDHETEQIKFVDFGISSELSTERQGLHLSKRLEGSLAYISPEQTGRMNRDLDYRSDYYSLGITFYELLTGKLPFHADQNLEWVHCHISKRPPTPQRNDLDIPPALIGIILKLMSKNAEDRYQGIYGLKSDLERCQQELTETGNISDFAPGQNDISEHFLIPQKLYGRERELAQLMNLFDKVSGGETGMCLVSGYSGVGKSALVSEIYKPVVKSKGYLIQGKYDQFQRNTPYSAIANAFGSMITQLLSESPEQLERWRIKLVETLGPSGRVITDLVPELEQIIGEQAEVPELPATEAQNRFQIVFIRFVKLFATQNHPLVIFLDDLQWCDAPTLNLIHRLVTSRELSHLLLIGAYRSNEVDVGHPLILTLNEIRQSRDFEEMQLQPLEPEAVKHLVADTLRCEPDRSQALANLLFQKAEGNPFFINELLKSFHAEYVVSFDPEAGRWIWDMDSVQRSSMSGDVVEFVVSNLRKLNAETQHVLELASCIGNTFDLKTLSIINEQSMELTSDELHNALEKNMILPLDEDYKFVNSDLDLALETDSGTDQGSVNPMYKFQHDRVQQAAYALIGDDRKQTVHLSIGRLIQQHAANDELEDQLISITGHLNIGRKSITDPAECRELAVLNLRAGQKAQHSAAYQSALEYLETGQQLLAGDPWKDDYELVKSLSLEHQQCAYLTGNLDDADARIDDMLGRVGTKLEKAEILSMRTRQYATIGKMEASIQAAIMGLSLLGIKISDNPGWFDIQREIWQVRWHLGKREIPDLIDAPKMTDPEKIVSIRLLNEIFPAAFLSGSGNLFPFLVLKLVNISLRHGNSPEAAFAYAAYGMLLCGSLNDPATGLKYGQLAVAMNDHFKDIKLKSRVIYVYGMFIHHWSNHWATMTPWFRKGIEAGYQSGDLLYLAYSAQDCIIWDPGMDLPTASAEQKKYLTIVKDCDYQDSFDSGTLFRQMQLNFQGLTNERFSLNDDLFDEQACIEGMRERKFMTGIANYQIYKSEICFLYGDYERALKHVRQQDKLVNSSMSLPQLVRFRIIGFLTLAALYPDMSSSEQTKTHKRLKKDLRQMSRWARNCPENFAHLKYCMEAELARLAGQMDKAISGYHAAIVAARDNGFVRDEAVANELLARYYIAEGHEQAAEGYLRAAHYLFYRWGAKRKVRQLEETYPNLLSKALVQGEDSGTHKTQNAADQSNTLDSATLDLDSVMQASRAISGEIVLDQLLRKVMQILLENAGGQKGYFVLSRDGQLVIEAQSQADGDENETGFELPYMVDEQNPVLPVSVINYVLRTRKHVVLDQAMQSEQFATDPYIVAHQPQSIICMPILRHGEFEGAIYMENNLTTGAFTEDRIEVMNLLSAQASISIENAQLYDSLETKVQERTSALTLTLDDLKTAQSQLVQSEKMAGLGTLVSGVAHEINNPTNFVHLGAASLDEELKEFKQLLFDLIGEDNDPDVIAHFKDQFGRFFLALENINEGTSRIRTIVQDLRTFSRLDEAEKKTVHLVENLESTLRLVRAQYAKEIDFKTRFDANPEIECLPAQLNQVFMNLMMNACQAIRQKYQDLHGDVDSKVDATTGDGEIILGSLTLATSFHGNEVAIGFTDTGTGMSKEVQQRIFEPFFTTKEVGEGTGMGMSISYQIIEKHQGRFEIESREGEGTTITILLPLLSNDVVSL
jgi:predicted ATPase/signal transduction histidine kinase/tRNA A-37 threonylcarbamoyl transferase component Bud32